MPLFVDSWKRIDRSVVHAEAFFAEFHRLFPQDGYGVRLDEEGPGTWIASAIFKTSSLDNSLALELGEFFYQLRGALDAAVWQAVAICEGAEPKEDTPGVNRLEFPLCCGKSKFEDSAIHRFKFPQQLKAWIGSVQPNSADKPPNDPDFGLNVTLELLHNCARKDRHRRLHVAAAVPGTIEYAIASTPPDLRIASIDPIKSDFLKGDNKFMRFGLESISGKPITKAELTTAITIDVVFDEIPIWSEGGFATELKRFGMATEQVINRFEFAFDSLSCC